jgi:hypothetical protein
MRTDIDYIKKKIDYLYTVDPPGPLMKLSTHLNEEAEEKVNRRRREVRNLSIFGTIAVLLAVVVDRVLAFIGIR